MSSCLLPCKPRQFFKVVFSKRNEFLLEEQISYFKGDHSLEGKFKAQYSSKISIFFLQERFNKLIYNINTIIKCGI